MKQTAKDRRDEAAAGRRSNERPAHREAEARGMRKADDGKKDRKDDSRSKRADSDRGDRDAGGMMPDRGPPLSFLGGTGGAVGEPAPPLANIPTGHGPE